MTFFSLTFALWFIVVVLTLNFMKTLFVNITKQKYQFEIAFFLFPQSQEMNSFTHSFVGCFSSVKTMFLSSTGFDHRHANKKPFFEENTKKNCLCVSHDGIMKIAAKVKDMNGNWLESNHNLFLPPHPQLMTAASFNFCFKTWYFSEIWYNPSFILATLNPKGVPPLLKTQTLLGWPQLPEPNHNL